MVVSEIRGTQYRPPYITILIRDPKIGPLLLRNLHAGGELRLEVFQHSIDCFDSCTQDESYNLNSLKDYIWGII